MLELYTWTTPNGIKPLIMLEELGLPHRTHWVDIGAGAQHTPDYLRINPNAKIPALVDGDARVFESGAVLIYLAELTGRLLPPAGAARAKALSWLFFQVASVGPMFGQLGHFQHAPERQSYAIARFQAEVERLFGVLEGRLSEAPYLADEYSIADVACFGWASRYKGYGMARESIPHVVAWLERMASRPAVQRALLRRP